MFFTSVFVPSSCLPGWPRTDVRVDAKASLLHADVADVEILQYLPKRPQIRAGFLCRAHVGLAHDLDQRNAGAIEVDRGHARDTGRAMDLPASSSM